jgi:hypothetical protein
VYIYYGKFQTKALEQIKSGDLATEKSKISCYPKDGFDLTDIKQRNTLYHDLFLIFKYCLSDSIKLSLHTSSKSETKVGETELIPPPLPPRLKSPQPQNPQRAPSPKRKLADEENHEFRPNKKPATEEAKADVKPVKVPLSLSFLIKLNSFGFGANRTSSPWVVPESSKSPQKKVIVTKLC